MIYEAEKGMAFYDVVKECKKQLKNSNSTYKQILFNEIYVTVSIDSNDDDIATIYDLKREIKMLSRNIKNLNV